MLQENICWAHIYVSVLKLEQQLESLTNSILKPQSPGRVGGRAKKGIKSKLKVHKSVISEVLNFQFKQMLKLT